MTKTHYIKTICVARLYRGRQTFILAVILCIGWHLAADATAHAANVLFLASYHSGHRWTDDIARGIYTTFSKSKSPHRIFTEYMDAMRFDGWPHRRQLTQWLRSKYGHIPLSAIIAADDPAISYLLKVRPSLFPDTPVIYCGANGRNRTVIQAHQKITGITEVPDLKSTVDLITTLHPETHHIFILNNPEESGPTTSKLLTKLRDDAADKIKITVLEKMPLKQLINRVGGLSQGQVLFYLSINTAQKLKSYEKPHALKQILINCRVPVYGAWDRYLGQGILGGKLVVGFEQGRSAARLALKILAGKKVESFKKFFPGPTGFMFDYKQLRRFGIDTGRLPEKSTLINHPRTIAEHKTVIIFFLGGIIALHFIIFFMVLNILKRRRAEANILRTQRRINTILESAKEGFVKIDSEGVVEDVNPEMCAMLNRSKQDIIGRSIVTCITSDTAETLYRHLQKSLSGTRCTFEVTLVRPDQQRLTCLFNMAPIWDDQLAGIGCFAMVSDITELKSAQQALEKNEEILRATFESTEDGLLVVAQDGSITHVNAKFIHMWDLSASQIYLLKNDRQLHKNMAQRLERPEELTSKIGPLHKKPLKPIETIKLRNGHILERFSCPLILEHRESGRVWSFRDITEKKELESQLFQAQKMEAIGNLAGGIAHDFNNRLQTISGYAQLLMQDSNRSEADRTKLCAIQRSVRNSCDLIDQLLMFSRKIESKLTPTDLNHEVRQIRKLFERTIARMIRIKLKLESNLGIINADPAQIEQVIMNLGINASHAMPAGGTLTIMTQNVQLDELFCKQHLGATPGKFVRLRVADTGLGMTKEIIDHIFEPFFTTKLPGKGTGLGLSMVHGIIKNHNGFITCKSVLNQGSCFDIYFPMLAIDLATMTLQVDSKTKMVGGKENILLVEDDEDNLDIGKSMLSRFGYTVFTATNYDEALNQFTGSLNRIDLTILDLNMPGTGGQPILKAILNNDPAAKILIASGFSGLAVKHALAAGAVGYIRKPYEMSELLYRVRKLIDQTAQSNDADR